MTGKMIWARWAGYIFSIFLLCFLIPQSLESPYYIRLLAFAWTNTIAAIGLQIAVGICGQINLGQAAYVGIAAYSFALSVKFFGWHWFSAAIVGIVAATIGGLGTGWISNRLRGPYLAIVTLALNLVFYVVVLNEVEITGGPMGISISTPFFRGRPMSLNMTYYVASVCAIVLYGLARLIYYSKVGRSFRAVRDDEWAAGILGINVIRAKVQACVLSSFFAGVAGVLYALNYRYLAPSEFTSVQSFRYLAMIVIGGLGSLSGAVAGAFAVTLVPEFLRMWPGLWDVILGLTILLVLLFFPRGMSSVPEHVYQRFSRRKAEERTTGQIRSTDGR